MDFSCCILYINYLYFTNISLRKLDNLFSFDYGEAQDYRSPVLKQKDDSLTIYLYITSLFEWDPEDEYTLDKAENAVKIGEYVITQVRNWANQLFVLEF